MAGETDLPLAAARKAKPNIGLAYWMERVLGECDRAGTELAADPVHDLRVALRRCRSMATGLWAIDHHPSWKELKGIGKPLFSSLGALRDVQVMEEWVHHLDSPDDLVTSKFLDFLATREAQLKAEAVRALQAFDRKQWRKLSNSTPRRATRFRPGSVIFKHLALEHWLQAYELHRRALRNRSQTALHQLRIGVKRFRYIVENFLPELHHAWGADLKQLQDWLGEIHDLDVLWSTMQQADVLVEADARARWQQRISSERESRLQKYREKMVGRSSLWHVWRAQLPRGQQIEQAALRRMKIWASGLDRDFSHANHVSRLALQLYDGFRKADGITNGDGSSARNILRLAALLHEVGRSKGEKDHHKATYRLVHRVEAPFGWSKQDLEMAGAVARYHRGALPRHGQRALQALSPEQVKQTVRLAAILRLANAFDSEHDGRVQRLQVSSNNGFFSIAAQGYSARERRAETIASARHLLEQLYRRPVMVTPLRAAPRR